MDVAAVTSAPLSRGVRFGDFVALRPLATGGMAELYLAARPGPAGRPPELAAVKRMLPHLGSDPEFVRMFSNEVRLAAGLRHPNIVRVLDFGVGEGGNYLAMEYLHGHTLRTVQGTVDTAGPLPLGFAVGCVIEIAAGLHAAHEHRDDKGRRVEVVHRDVAPSNVIVTFDGRVKILDFGIARATAHTDVGRRSARKGQVGYMSPEQCRAERVDRRSDVFGIGILLYELTTGRRAFTGDNDFAVMARVRGGTYVPPEQIVPGYPGELRRILTRALAVDPADRFRTAGQLHDALDAFAGVYGLAADAASRAALMRARFGDPPPPRIGAAELSRAGTPPRRWWRRGAWALAIAALLAGLGLSLAIGSDDDAPGDADNATPTTAPATSKTAPPPPAPPDRPEPPNPDDVASDPPAPVHVPPPPPPPPVADDDERAPDRRRRRRGRKR